MQRLKSSNMNIHHQCCAQHLQILVDKQYCMYYTQSGSARAGHLLPCNTPIKTAVRQPLLPHAPPLLRHWPGAPGPASCLLCTWLSLDFWIRVSLTSVTTEHAPCTSFLHFNLTHHPQIPCRKIFRKDKSVQVFATLNLPGVPRSPQRWAHSIQSRQKVQYSQTFLLLSTLTLSEVRVTDDNSRILSCVLALPLDALEHTLALLSKHRRRRPHEYFFYSAFFALSITSFLFFLNLFLSYGHCCFYLHVCLQA